MWKDEIAKMAAVGIPSRHKHIGVVGGRCRLSLEGISVGDNSQLMSAHCADVVEVCL